MAISWAAQPALREIIKQIILADFLVGRVKMDTDQQWIIDDRTTRMEITVQSVEIRDLAISPDLKATISRQPGRTKATGVRGLR
jgi:regulator of protease activity HflC (stomatin/prohibitin superfamily)